jgi:hypothetical protein
VARFLLEKIRAPAAFHAVGAFALERKMTQSTNTTDHSRVTRSVEVTVNGPVEKVFSLFTPEGETHWIPTWHYSPIYPSSGETVRDMVFRTDEQTLWTLAVYEPPRRSVYVYASPDILVRIEVDCHAIDNRHTSAKVTWVVTALTQEGLSIVEQKHNETVYQNRTNDWKQWLNRYANQQGWA